MSFPKPTPRAWPALSRVLALGAGVVLISAGAAAQGAGTRIPIAAESFDYAPGDLAGANGGSGFSTPWFDAGPVATQVILPGQDAIGGKLCTPGGDQPQGALRGFDTSGFPTVNGEFGADGSSFAFSFQFQLPPGSNPDFAGVALLGTQSPPLFFGVIPGSNQFGYLDNQGTFTPTWVASLDMPHEIYISLADVGGANEMGMWIDPIDDPPTAPADLVSHFGNGFSFSDLGILVDGGSENVIDIDGIALEFIEASGCLGTMRCDSNPNSTGSAAELCVTGSLAVQDNNFTASAEPVPDTAGIFFFGRDSIQLPFGNGFRCAGGEILRERVSIASGGIASMAIDLTLPRNVANFVPGSDWDVQYWVRDPMGAGSNFNLSNSTRFTWE